MKTSVKERLKDYLKQNSIKGTEFCRTISVSSGYIAGMRESIQPDKLESIAINYPDLNIGWLLTGVGDMENKSSMLYSEEKFLGGSPYYEDLPASAGELEIVETKEVPTGYIKIPNVSAQWFFPVIGCSMMPHIKQGDIIGVNEIELGEMMDPDRTYLIVLHDERMIKHLRNDNEDSEILWCVSSNYHEFKIMKNDIVHLYQVVFHGELM